MDNIYVLALETSSRVGSVAIGRGCECLDEAEFTAGTRHGVELIPTVDRLIRQIGIGPDQLGVICVSAGPGSFTGLRIGFTFARCLSQVTGAKLVAVSSTRVIAENLKPLLTDQSGPIYIAPILDAKRKQVYTAGYCWQGGRLEETLSEQVCAPQELVAALGRPLWITGEGIDYHRDHFSVQDDLIFVDRQYWLGRAKTVLRIGCESAKQDQFIPYNNLAPTYIRLPEAEERWRQRQAEK